MLEMGVIKKLITTIPSNISSTESNVNTCISKAWAAIDKSTTIQKCDLSDKIKQEFFKVVTMSVLLYGCTTWTFPMHHVKRLDRNYTRTLCAVLNKSWKQHPTKQLQYGHLSPILQSN